MGTDGNVEPLPAEPRGAGAASADSLYRQLEGELRRLAARQLDRQEPGHTLQTTALVNEAWLRLAPLGYEGREHFLAVAARAMRSVLVDHARRKRADRRGGGAVRLELDEALVGFEAGAEDLVALDAALAELESADPTLASIVELRFFAGLSNPEVARVQGTSLRSVERGWRAARAWLRTRLDPESPERDSG